MGILCKKTISGMNGLSILDFCRTQDIRDVSVTLSAVRRAHADPFIGEPDMECGLIGF